MAGTEARGFFAEIAESPALRVYGAALSVLHPLTVYFWRPEFLFRFSGRIGVTCHTFWPWCWPPILSDSTVAAALIWIYVFTGLAATGLFLFAGARIGPAVTCLIAATVLKFFFFIHDYNFMGNYHYMALWATAVFLLAPHKRQALALVVIGFYLAAGSLKFTTQWILGEGLDRPPFLSPPAFALSCLAVVVLETIGVFGLLAGRRAIRWATLACLVIFHVSSYYWVYYFYPSVMTAVASIFPLIWCLEPERAPSWVEIPNWPKAAFVPFTLLFFAQLPPHFFPGDAAVTSRGREFSLNMYDARTQCFDLGLLRFKDTIVEVSSAERRSIPMRTQCDPLNQREEMRSYCREISGRADFMGASLRMISRRTTDPLYWTVIDEPEFCGGPAGGASQ